MSWSRKRVVFWLVFTLAALGAIVILRFKNWGIDSEKVRQVAYERYEDLSKEEAIKSAGGKDYVKRLVDRFHEECYKESCAGGKFEAKKYNTLMDAKIKAQIRADTDLQELEFEETAN